MYRNATCIFLFLLGQLQAEIPVPSYWLEMKNFATHWAATSCVWTMTFMQHIQLLKLKLEKILTITNIQYVEWQSGSWKKIQGKKV